IAWPLPFFASRSRSVTCAFGSIDLSLAALVWGAGIVARNSRRPIVLRGAANRRAALNRDSFVMGRPSGASSGQRAWRSGVDGGAGIVGGVTSAPGDRRCACVVQRVAQAILGAALRVRIEAPVIDLLAKTT